MERLFVGVDVGTASARAGVFDANGRLRGASRHPIRLWREPGGIAEQSSDDIWAAVARSVRAALREANAGPEAIGGLGFAATCSLVVVDRDGAPLAIGPPGDPARNVVAWMDHRARDEARQIDATRHPLLRFFGGAIWPEMQAPKLLWLKTHRPETYRRAGHFFDLADYLSWRATGSLRRSVCTLSCKWAYLSHEHRWDGDFLAAAGLGDLVAVGVSRIGSEVAPVAAPLGEGLTAAAAETLGLRPGIPVGAPLVDAHAGGLGTLGAADPEKTLALVMGTSSCVMALAPEPHFAGGIWGPHFGAVLPGSWLLEGGQSASGAALDAILPMHPAFPEADAVAAAAGLTVPDHLERVALELAGSAETVAELAAGLHVVPDFLGRRSPEADPSAAAVLSGLRLDAGIESLARLFVATLCGLCYGTREIVEAMAAAGLARDTLVVSGGAARSRLLPRLLADATGLGVALPATGEPVLLGAAMLGATAGGAYPDLGTAAAAMGRIGAAVRPGGAAAQRFHGRKFAAYRLLKAAERETRRLMADV